MYFDSSMSIRYYFDQSREDTVMALKTAIIALQEANTHVFNLLRQINTNSAAMLISLS